MQQWSHREDAERAVRNLGGVHGVTNTITVKQPWVVASSVRKAIEEALDRRAEREAKRIEVKVDDGTVTLSGRVYSWEGKLAVAAAARYAPGVVTLNDRLRVEA